VPEEGPSSTFVFQTLDKDRNTSSKAVMKELRSIIFTFLRSQALDDLLTELDQELLKGRDWPGDQGHGPGRHRGHPPVLARASGARPASSSGSMGSSPTPTSRSSRLAIPKTSRLLLLHSEEVFQALNQILCRRYTLNETRSLAPQ
jgi:hypothetical protein